MNRSARQPKSDAVHKEARITLQSRLAITFTITTLVILVGFWFATYRITAEQSFQAARQRLEDVLSITLLQVNGDRHSMLVMPSQESSPMYIDIRGVLQDVRNTNKNITQIYTFRVKADQLIYVIDSETNASTLAHLGDVEDLDAALRARLEGLDRILVDETYTTGRRGTILSGYAPVKTGQGQVDAYLRMDMDVSGVVARQQQIFWSVLALCVGALSILALGGWFTGRAVGKEVNLSAEALDEIVSGKAELRSARPTAYSRELAHLSAATQVALDHFSGVFDSLERRIVEGKREADRRSQYLQAASEVSHVAASTLELDSLIKQVVDLVRTRFDLYYVGMFLLDPEEEWAILKAGTGTAGEAMLARGHRIRVGEGMIGWCIANSQIRVAQDVEQDAIRLSALELPLTRSEAALPMRSRGKIIGAVSVQSDQPLAFDEQSLNILQTMIDQVSVSLDNARLFAESQEAIAALQHSYQQVTRAAWSEFLRSRKLLGYESDDRGVRQVSADKVLELQFPETPQPHGKVLYVPVKVRGRLLGTIRANLPEGVSEWSAENIALMEKISDQLSAALDNARLYEATQRSVERERALAEITSRVRASTSVDVILQTAIRELSSALRVAKGVIQLRPSDGDRSNE